MENHRIAIAIGQLSKYSPLSPVILIVRIPIGCPHRLRILNPGLKAVISPLAARSERWPMGHISVVFE